MSTTSKANLQQLPSLVAPWLLGSIMVGVLVGVLPFFTGFMSSSKIAFFLGGSLLLVILYGLKAILTHQVRLTLHPLQTPILLFIIGTALSTFLTGPYPYENLLNSGGIYLAFGLITLFGSSILAKNVGHGLYRVLVGTGWFLTAATILQAFGFGFSRILSVLTPVELTHDLSFSLAGNALIAAQILGVILVAEVWQLLKNHQKNLQTSASIIAIAIGLIINVWVILPGKPTSVAFLPFGASWSVALDTLRTVKTALIGFGPDGYQVAYNLYRPSWLNNTIFWQAQPSQGFNTPLTLLPTLGLLGLMSWVLLIAIYIKQILKPENRQNPWAIIVGATLGLQLLLPSNLAVLLIQCLGLAVWIAQQRQREIFVQAFSIQITDHNHVPQASQFSSLVGRVVGGLLILLSVVGLYFLARGYLASYYLYQAAIAAQKNQVVQSYDLQRKAVSTNAYIAAYRRQYALTNIQIALALSNKADISEEEQKQVVALIQQAIREGRAATALQPLNSTNWMTLAAIYRQLIGATDDANQWTISTLSQAISTDPYNPSLRLELAGLMYQQKQYSQALSLAQQAVQLKPDLANAYYNAANSLRELGQLENARQAYQQTLSLLQADSDAYLQASKELQEVEKKIESLPATKGTLPKPSPTPTASTSATQNLPSILDQNLQPDEDVITPSQNDTNL